MSVGLKADGSVVAWEARGTNLCFPALGDRFVDLAVGWDHILAMEQDGSIMAIGGNDFGQLDVPELKSKIRGIGAGPFTSFAIDANGSIIAWGECSLGQCDVPAANSGFIDVVCGAFSCLGVKGPPKTAP